MPMPNADASGGTTVRQSLSQARGAIRLLALLLAGTWALGSAFLIGNQATPRSALEPAAA